MIEKRGNHTWYKSVKSYFKLAKKGRVVHVVASMVACLTFGVSSPVMSATVETAKTETVVISDAASNLTVTETGSITVTNASAIEAIMDPFYGTVINNGSISCAVTSEDDEAALNFDGLNAALITNSGTIDLSMAVQNNTENGYFAAIFATAVDNYSSITNSGTIGLNLTVGDNAANGYYAAGIYASSVDNGSSITNLGTIDLTTTLGDSADNVNVWGLDVGPVDNASSIINSGTINFTTTGGDDSFSSAQGISVAGNIDNGSSIINSGIMNFTTTLGDSYAYVSGIRVEDNIYNGSSITNSGTMNLTTTVGDDDGASVSGIRVEDNIDNGNSLTNSGTMNFSTTVGNYSYAYVSGIRVEDNIDNGSSITNSGTMDLTTTVGDNGGAYVSGIRVEDNIDNTSSITNSETMNLTTTVGDDSFVSVSGIRVDDNIDNTSSIINSGTMDLTTTVEDNGGASVSGIRVNGNIDYGSSIINSGTIDLTTTVGDDSYAYVSGIRVRGNLDNTSSITNSDTMNFTTTVGNYFGASVSGIRVDDNIDNTSSITNSGTMDFTTTAGDYSWATVSGIRVNGNIYDGSSITNSGTMNLTTTVGDNSDAYVSGIRVDGIMTDSTIENSGAINITTTFGDSASFSSYGIIASSSGSDSEIINSGTMELAVHGTDADNALVVGIQSYDTLVTNSGTITATADSDENTYGYGIYNVFGDVVNSGTVTASLSSGELSDNFFAVYTGGSLTNSGTLNGRLYTGGDTQNSGTIMLSTGESSISGDFTQTTDGTLGITINTNDSDNIEYSVLSVDGTASLADGSGLYVDITTSSADLYDQTVTGVVISDTAIDVDIDALDVTDNSALLDVVASLSSNDTAIDLTLEQSMTIYDAVSQSGSLVGADVGAVLDDILMNSDNDDIDSDIETFISQLNSQATTEQVAQMVAQLVPVGSTQTPAMTKQVISTIGGVIQARQGGGNSGDPMFSDKNMWVKPFAIFTDQDDDNGMPGFSADTYGFGMGLDGELLSGSTLGFAMFYSSVDAETNNMPQSTQMDVINLMAYGSKPLTSTKDFTLHWQVGGGFQDTETSRYITDTGTAEADYTGTNLFAQVRGVKTFNLRPDLMLTGGAVASYTWLYTPSYAETGVGGLDLDVESNDSHSLVPGLEGGVSWFPAAGVSVKANVFVGYDVINDDVAVTSRFQGGGASFITEGIDNSPFVYSAGVSLGKQFTDTFSLVAGYDFEGQGNDLMTHMASCKFSVKF